MKYGELETTGVVERRGARHALHLECICSCGTRKFVRKDVLEQGKVVTCGQPHSSLLKHFYVKVGDSTDRWAVGEPDEINPWGPFVHAREMTRQEAETWKIRRIAFRNGNIYPASYKILEL